MIESCTSPQAPDRAETDALGDRIAEQAAHLDAATHRLLADIREFDRHGGWHRQGFKTCARWLSWRVGWGSGVAREHVRVARRLAELPRIDDCLRQGLISYSKVRAITRVATPANEETLLSQAQFTTGDQMEKICSAYAAVVRSNKPNPRDDRERRCVRFRDLPDGMVRIEAVLFADEVAIVRAALDRVAAERCRATETQVEAAPATPSAAMPEPAPMVPDERHVSAETREISERHVSAETREISERHVSAETRESSERHVSAETGETSERPLLEVLLQLDPWPKQLEPDDSDSCADTYGTWGMDPVTVPTTPVVSPAPAPTLTPPARRYTFDRADALLEIMEGIVRGTSRQRAPIEVVLTVPARGLHDGDRDPLDAAHFADGTCVSAETAMRLCCDAGVVDMVEDEQGNAISVGRKTRTIPGSMKRALLRRDTRCRFPGCNNQGFLHGHHIKHWAHGGETSTRNIVLLCSFHHMHVHEYGFTVVNDPATGITFRNPDGLIIPDVPPRPQPIEVGWKTIEAQNRELDIRLAKLPPGWNGERVYWPWVIEEVVRADARGVN